MANNSSGVEGKGEHPSFPASLAQLSLHPFITVSLSPIQVGSLALGGPRRTKEVGEGRRQAMTGKE